MAKVDGIALGTIGAGALLLYAGVTNKDILSVIQGTIQGKSPATDTTLQPAGIIQGTPSPPPGPTPTPGQVAKAGTSLGTTAATRGGSTGLIASDALQYKGKGYVWGGAPAKGAGNWDCSSFVNWVIGHDLGLAIPGVAAGSYTGKTHGPTTLSWLAWSGVKTVGHSSSSAQAGDLCVWQTHMGIALGGGQMISALNSSQGTAVTSIDGIVSGEALFVRRY